MGPCVITNGQCNKLVTPLLPPTNCLPRGAVLYTGAGDPMTMAKDQCSDEFFKIGGIAASGLVPLLVATM